MSVYKRGKVWYVNVRINKERIQKPAGRTKDEALETQRLLKAQRFRRNKHIAFDYAAQQYLNHVKHTLSPRSYKMDLTDYNKHLKPFFNLFFVDDMSNDVLNTFQRRQKQKGLANRTVNMHMGLIRRIMNFADIKEYVSVLELKLKYPMLREPKKIAATLTPDEFEAIQHISLENYKGGLSKRNRLLVRLALCRIKVGVHTGLRPAELAHLEWADVDIKQRSLLVQSKPHYDWIIKTAEERAIPLNASAIAALHEIEKTGPLVFSPDTVPVLSIRGSIRTAAAKSGIDRNITPGMLRHSYASLSLASGADVKSVQLIMGHKSLETTQKYTHGLVESMRAAVDALDNRFATKNATTRYKGAKRKGNKKSP